MIHLFGSTSIVGYSLTRNFPDKVKAYYNPHNKSTTIRDPQRISLNELDQVKRFFLEQTPKCIIFGDAICDVAKCQEDPQWAYEINVKNLQNFLSFLPDETRFVYLSSDHVFGGDGVYTESSPVQPITIYGETRVEAEKQVLKRANSLVIRSGLPIGPSLDGKSGHLDWLQYRHRKGFPMTIIQDEYRSVVWADDLAKRIMELAETDICGIRHIPAESFISRVELVSYLVNQLKISPQLELKNRSDQPYPHLGQVEIQSDYRDNYAQPLPNLISLSLAEVL